MDVAFWDYFYKSSAFSGAHDCYCPFEALEPTVLPLLPPNGQIVHIGCGNSELGPALYDRGWQNVVNVDFCRSVVEEMQVTTPSE